MSQLDLLEVESHAVQTLLHIVMYNISIGFWFSVRWFVVLHHSGMVLEIWI